MVEKVKDIMKKMFKSKNQKNSIIAIVALIQCIILIVVTSYSWIESQSSLKIKGENLPIASNLNYRFDVKDGATNNVDLSTYFRPSALYQLSKASTPDAKNFYFKKDGASTYRLGDTTDYNTSYYHFDFQIHNETAKSFNYYFNKSDIFDVTSDNSDVTEAMLTVAEKAMRISVTAGTNTSNTRIYSIDTKTYPAINSKAGGTKSTTSTGLSGTSQYTYSSNTDPSQFVFSTTGGGDDTKVTVKIWFEEKDAQYQALTDAQKKALLGCTVNINFQFVNAASNFQTFFFDDYTFSTAVGHEGKHVTTEDQSKKLYFYYKEGNTVSVVPMTTTTAPSGSDAIRWVTASDEGDPTPRISDDMRKKLADKTASGYFFYGTYNATTGTTTESYKWPIGIPAVNDGGVYIFKALSVFRNALVDTGNTGYGVWDNIDIELYKFKDMATSATADSLNPKAFQFINQAEQGRLYLTKSATDLSSATKMYYDETKGLWLGYYDKLSETQAPIYSYTSDTIFIDSNIKVQWTATNPMENEDGEKIYTALGYEGTGAANDLSKAPGVGTWANVEEIKLSTELVDDLMKKDYRYKICVDFGDNTTDNYKYYYMAMSGNTTTWKAYVPVDSGNTTYDAIKFQRFESYNTDTVSGTWNDTKTARDGSSIYYATDMNATNSNGQWHIGVVVDGSENNVINDILTNVENSKLEYSTDDGVTYIAMNQLDDYRWYTNDFDGDVENITYRWTAYTGVGVNEAVFSYGHDLANGIYFNITE